MSYLLTQLPQDEIAKVVDQLRIDLSPSKPVGEKAASEAEPERAVTLVLETA